MEWYQKLEEKYKHLFEQGGQGLIIRGIECGQGWEKHIISFLESLEWIRTHNLHLNKDLKDGEFHNIKIFQIKEKFGECRCYVSADEYINDQVDDAVAKLEALCSVTCEACGKLEYGCIKSQNHWIYCLCEECFNRKTIKQPSYTDKEKLEIYESLFQKIYVYYALCLNEPKVKESLELIYNLSKLPEFSDRDDYKKLEYDLLTTVKNW